MADQRNVVLKVGAGTIVAIVAVALVVTARSAVRSARRTSCESNLKQIGTAMAMYVQDYDQVFPPAYTATYRDTGRKAASWASLLSPYTKSAISNDAGWCFVGGWNDIDVPGAKGPSGMPESPWHCPDDMPNAVLSYGVNPMVSGAYKAFDIAAVNHVWTRAQEWQDSLRMSQIGDPSEIVWVGDTNRLWDDKNHRYAQVFPDWPRRTDVYLRDLSDNDLHAWYSSFLKRNLTNYGDACPYPLAWGCRAPAYRHGKLHPTTTMLMCDGHVRAFPLGKLTIANIFPNLQTAVAKPDHRSVEYRIVPIESGSVHSGMHAGGLNNFGEVAGGNYWDMIWWKNGQAHDIPAPDWKGSGISWGVNDSGVIVGNDKLYVKGKFLSLGLMPGYEGIAARAINNRGQVVGRAFNGSGAPTGTGNHAFLWQDGKFTDLGVPAGCVSSTAYAINDRGQVVGSAVTKDDHTHAFLWSNGVMKDLGTLPGGSLSIAYGINNKGQVVGDSDAAVGKGFIFHPVLWENGRPRDLGAPTGYRYCIAKAINEQGTVVCATTDLDHVPLSPMIWDAKHGMRPLDHLCAFDSGWLLRDAYAINKRGQILCWGFYHNEMSLALLTPSTATRPRAASTVSGNT